jgi:hypothetical protein
MSAMPWDNIIGSDDQKASRDLIAFLYRVDC